MDYITVDDIKASMPDITWGITYDVELARIVTAACRGIDHHCRRPDSYFYSTGAVTRYYSGDGTDRLWLDLPLCAVPTTLAVDDNADGIFTTWSVSTDIILWPFNDVRYYRLDINHITGLYAAFPKGTNNVRITGNYGHSMSLDPVIVQSALIQAVRWFKRGQSGFADASLNETLGKLVYMKALDPDVAALLNRSPYMDVL